MWRQDTLVTILLAPKHFVYSLLPFSPPLYYVQLQWKKTVAFKLTLRPQSRYYIYSTDTWWEVDDTHSPAVLAWGLAEAILNAGADHAEWKTPVWHSYTDHKRLNGYWKALRSVWDSWKYSRHASWRMVVGVWKENICACAIDIMNNSLCEH